MSAHLDNEETLVLDAQAGSREAFATLLNQYARRLFRLALNITGNQDDAADALQEAFLKAFRALRSFRGESQFSTWLFRIAVNEARMKVRKRREVPLETIFPDDDDGDYTPTMLADWREIPSEALLKEETRRLVRESIADLPEKYREVLTLRDVNGKNIAETSEILGISIGNTKVRLLRARLMLRDIFVERTRRKPKQQPAKGVSP